MRVALAVLRVVADPQANKDRILTFIREATAGGAGLVLFPETATTGLVNDDNPNHDYALAEPIPNPFLSSVARVARTAGLHVGLGTLERDGCAIYDSFVLFSNTGELVVHYRRNDPGWHGKNADPAVYREGTEIVTYDHPQFGRVCALLCGDLFDDALVRKVRDKRVDLLLFPFARAFDDGSRDEARWGREELPSYVAQIRKAGALTLMVNYVGPPELDDFSFGGAWVVDKDGAVQASLSLGREGILLYDLAG